MQSTSVSSFIPYLILLGSGSPRRREILSMACLPFEICPIICEESYPSHLVREQIPLYLSEKKSMSFTSPIQKNQILLTADTIVWCNDTMLGKPENKEHAMEILRLLSGKKHTVYTGITLRNPIKKVSFYEKTEVYFRSLEEEEICFYVEHFSPMDKAGSYGVQEWIGVTGIERIEGCFYNVMGLPAARLIRELKRF